LAILTAVVSENMISATQDHEEAENKETESSQVKERRERLTKLFGELDGDADGFLTHEEFKEIVNDETNCEELVDASGLEVSDLEEIFLSISTNKCEDDDMMMMSAWYVKYDNFIETLLVEGNDVSERSLLRLELQMRQLEERLTRKFSSHLTTEA